jgi:hypothetical protein
MANQAITSNLQLIKFRNDFFREYVRTNRLAAFTGTGVNNAIVMKEGKEPTIRHPLVTRLKGSGVSGSDTLRGNGESIGNYSWDTNPTYYRHSVEFDREQLDKTNLALMATARPLLMEWAMMATRDRQIQAMGGIYNGTTYSNYVDAAEAAKDTWQDNNSDRVIYGANITLTGDDSAELGGVDSTNDTFTSVRVSDMRRKAEDADPHIRPYQTDEEGEVYVILAGSIAFRDLKANLQTINSNADVRGMKITSGGNVIARDGDLFFDGCIIRKVPEITGHFSATGKPLATAGNGSGKVEPVFLCGAQALVHGLGQKPRIIVDRDYDYDFQPGVAVELKEDVKKAFFNNVQQGMVTGYFSGVA